MVQRSIKIFLIRHGEDTSSVMGKFEDLPLTIEGESQSHKIAKKLDQYQLTSLYSSPMKRTIQTSEIIAQKYNLEVIVEDNIKDRDVGLARGLTFTEVRERFSSLLKKNHFSMDFKFPDGESNIDVYERAGVFLKKLLHAEKGTSEGIAVVSHPLILNYIIYQLQGFGFLQKGLYYAFEPSTMAIFQLQETYYQMIYFS